MHSANSFGWHLAMQSEERVMAHLEASIGEVNFDERSGEAIAIRRRSSKRVAEVCMRVCYPRVATQYNETREGDTEPTSLSV